MRPRTLFLLAILLATTAHAAPVAETRATLRQEMLRLINRDRALYQLAPLELDPEASAIADAYCAEQLRYGTTGHFTVDGLAPYMRYSFAGGNDRIVENAAAWSARYPFTDRALYEMLGRSEDAMMAEMPPHDGHRRAILDPFATHAGIGVAWGKGELRIVQLFVRHHLQWKRLLPRKALPGESVTGSGAALDGATVEAVTVHFEPLPQPLSAAAASAIASYALPEERREYRPRVAAAPGAVAGPMEVARREPRDGGSVRAGADGTFSFTVPLDQGAGIYTVVVWIRKAGVPTAVAASNVSIRVEASPTEPAAGTRPAPPALPAAPER